VDGQRKALIVASDEYEHEGLRRLLSPAADADALAGVLGDPRIGGFDVQVVRNEPAHIIQARIEDLFSDRRPDDLLLLHFSCHGLKSESGELFFAAANTRPGRLGSTAVPAEFVQRCMRASRSRSIVVLLDCCYGGAFGEGVTVRAAGEVNVLDSLPGERLGGGRGRAVITASSAMEYAFEGDQLADEGSRQPSVFTAALVEGLATGEADRDEDGWVALNELYDYVFDRVRERNPNQTPSRDIEMQGELYLARSRRRRIQALAIPADLRAASTDPNMFTRLGALTELCSRLASENLPVAAGAYDALTVMAGTDIRHVADAARTALDEVAVRLDEPVLHFGRVSEDSGPAHRVVRLLGPPLARACTLMPSHDWIRVDETADGFDVTVDTSATGPRSGSIAITGPTGETAIAVDVEVVPGTGRRRSGRPKGDAARSWPTTTSTAPSGTGPRQYGDGGFLRLAGELAILGAALLMAGLLPEYKGSDSIWERANQYGAAERYVWHTLTMAPLLLVAGACIFVPRTRRVTGPGLLLGAVAASTMGLAYLNPVRDPVFTAPQAGYWLELSAHLILLLAAGLTVIALVAEPGVRLVRTPRGALASWALVLGTAGSLTLVFHTLLIFRHIGDEKYQTLFVNVAATVMALAVPACAALAVPRRFGVFLLAGWIIAGATFSLSNFALLEEKSLGTATIIIFGFTLIGLAVIAGYLDRAEPARISPLTTTSSL
jgi:hypothetical protein